MPQQRQPKQQQPTQDFHDMASSCDWPKEIRELHAIAREQYGTYLRLDWQETFARKRATDDDRNVRPDVAAYQCLASHAYALLKRINERGAALVAQWDAENAAMAAYLDTPLTDEERQRAGLPLADEDADVEADTFYCEQCGKTLPDSEIALTVNNTSSARYVCADCLTDTAKAATAPVGSPCANCGKPIQAGDTGGMVAGPVSGPAWECGDCYRTPAADLADRLSAYGYYADGEPV